MMHRGLAACRTRWRRLLGAGAIALAGATVLPPYLQGRLYVLDPLVRIVSDTGPMTGAHAWRNRTGDLIVRFPAHYDPPAVRVFANGELWCFPGRGSLSLGPIEVLRPDVDHDDENESSVGGCDCSTCALDGWTTGWQVTVCDARGKRHGVRIAQ